MASTRTRLVRSDGGRVQAATVVAGLPSQPGTYVLVLRACTTRTVTVGRLGELIVQPGWYVYAGSALGPGGLAARLGRHLRPLHCVHWHIDYLRTAMKPVAICYAVGDDRRECAWALALAHLSGASIPLPGFGSSDCRCPAHLVRVQTASLMELRLALALSTELHYLLLGNQENLA